MKTSSFQVLSQAEIETIHNTSMHILAHIGVKVDYPRARQVFREAGADVSEDEQRVRIPENVLMAAIRQAPSQFTLFGNDRDFNLSIGGDNNVFACLGTPTRIIDPETGQVRPSIMHDVVRHIQLVSSLDNIHGSQMDVWPNDIPMTTIHSEAILAWVRHGRKSFGMGCYGYLPTLDMMRMMGMVAGGKEALRKRPTFMAICSVMSPLQMSQMQVEGLFLCAEYGQPLAISPEGIAGATAPVTLAGLLAQENAAILAHIALTQIYRPGTPVLYGTVSTIANMRHGTVALGSVETGLITAASAQLAKYYGLPCRSVGAATESKGEDTQAGIERTATLIPAVLAGVNYITCAGTLDGTMLESEAMLVLDDELCGSLARMARGIEVNDENLALDLIDRIGFSGNYLGEEHTLRHYRKEHFLPRLMVRDPYETWEKGNRATAVDLARQRAANLIEKHQAREIDPLLNKELSAYAQKVAARQVDDFYAGELPENQDWDNL